MKHPLTLDAFADWVEKKDPNETYHWQDYENCACGQYARSLGLFEQWNRALQGYEFVGPSVFWNHANNIADYGGMYGGKRHTFGALAERLRAHIHCESNRHASMAE